MATILNIDTSTEVCSVALSVNGVIRYKKESTEGLNHSKVLTVFIQQIFEENNIDINIIDAVAVSKGPGSYTGLRIGVSVAKGLCYALDIPLIGIGTLDGMGDYMAKNYAMYLGEMDNKDILFCPMIDARRMEVYTALYNKYGKIEKSVSAKVIENNAFEKWLSSKKIVFFGNGAAKCKKKLINENAIFVDDVKNSAEFMIGLSEEKFCNKQFENVAYFEPFYLKNFIATKPKNKIIPL